MLDDVAALVRRDGGRGDVASVVDVVTQVHGLRLGIVVVREGSFDGDDIHVMDAVGLQHPLGHLGAAEARRDLGILLETALEAGLDDHRQDHHRDHYDPNHRTGHSALFFTKIHIFVRFVGRYC